MTTHELARLLLSGPDLPIHTQQPAGDYWQTTLAPEVTKVEQSEVTFSSYHRENVIVEQGDCPARDFGKTVKVVTIR
jgi:hypothetical protein